MKKIVFTCLMLAAISFAASAQNKRQPDAAATTTNTNTARAASLTGSVEAITLSAAQIKSAELKAEQNAKSLKAKLALNATQYKQVYEAEKNFQKEADRWPAGVMPSGHMSNITSERNKQIKAVLNESQQQKYDEIQAKSN